MRSRLAEVLRCEPSYVTRVLQGIAHLSLEQADQVGAFLGHSEDEDSYFLLLVQRERAGTQNLRRRFDRELEAIRKKRSVLKNRFKSEQEIGEKEHYIYFSQWINAAIHVALTIPELQQKDALAKHFGLPVLKITHILEFLVSIGVAEQQGDKYITGSARLHLGTDSPLIAKNHIDWRLQAIRRLEHDDGTDLHYSSVVSVAKKDIERLRARLVRTIEEFKIEVRESPAEALCSFGMDFYRI